MLPLVVCGGVVSVTETMRIDVDDSRNWERLAVVQGVLDLVSSGMTGLDRYSRIDGDGCRNA